MDYNALEKLFDVLSLPTATSEALSNHVRVSTAATTPTGSRCRLFPDHMVSAEVAFPCNEQPVSGFTTQLYFTLLRLHIS